MNIRNKTDVYNKIVRDLKEMPVISDIVLKKETDFNFESTILHKIRIFFNLRSGGDIMILKGELEKDDAEENELQVLGSSLSNNAELSYTTFDNKLIMQSVVLLAGIDDTEAENKVYDKTMEFIKFFVDKEELLDEIKEISSENQTIDNKKSELNSDFNTEDLNKGNSNKENYRKGEIPISSEKNTKDNQNSLVNHTKGQKKQNELPKKRPNQVNKKEYHNASNDKKDISNNKKETQQLNNKNILQQNNCKQEQLTQEFDNLQNNEKKAENKYTDPSVVEQMHQLYKEMDSVFEKRKGQIDYREKTLDGYAKRLELKEQELLVKEEEINKNYIDMEQEIESHMNEVAIAQDNINFQWKKLNMERESLDSQKKELDEELALIKKSNNLVIESLDKQDTQEINSLKKQIDSIEKEKDKLLEQNEELTKLNASLKQNLSDIKSELDVLKNKPNTNDETQKIIIELEESLKNEKNEIAKQKELVQSKENDIEKYKRKLDAFINVDTIVNTIIKDASAINITLDKQQEQDYIQLVGESKGCKIIIYPSEHILMCTKEVKRGLKYQKNISEWNLKYRAALYTYTDRTVVCKSTFENLSKTLVEILSNISSLN